MYATNVHIGAHRYVDCLKRTTTTTTTATIIIVVQYKGSCAQTFPQALRCVVGWSPLRGIGARCCAVWWPRQDDEMMRERLRAVCVAGGVVRIGANGLGALRFQCNYYAMRMHTACSGRVRVRRVGVCLLLLVLLLVTFVS